MVKIRNPYAFIQMSWDPYLKSLLELKQSIQNRDEMVSYVGNDPKRMAGLFALFIDDTLHWRYNQRAAWPIGIIARKNPELLKPFLPEMAERLGSGRHDAVTRNIVRILEDVDIPESLEGIVYDKCFRLLNDPDQAIAIRVFSMSVMFKIARRYPEMLDELATCIRMYLPYGSAGFKNRGNKILTKIDKILNH